MAGFDDLRGENAALRDRISKLSDAVLRISSSLDLETVLREVVDSARALTGARYGMIATIDRAGAIEEFIAPGLTDDERRHMGQWPHGQAFYEHLRDLPGPLRVADLPAYLRSLGYTEELTLSKTLQATPMRHRGEHVGHFFLGEKARGEAFTDEDEEVLVLFASQAATAIANARTHRDERRARADLEALVDTTPVGVVVFDAGSGRAVSFNREARRLVEGLRTPGEAPEQLLEVLTCRRSDGREVALGEVPLALALGTGETVRAEEIELSVPDGRRLTTLLNATPIAAADGTVETVVVTMQDLAPLEELDRLRAEFLGMVSHELRAPLAAVKGSAATVLGAGPELDPAEMRAFFRVEVPGALAAHDQVAVALLTQPVQAVLGGDAAVHHHQGGARGMERFEHLGEGVVFAHIAGEDLGAAHEAAGVEYQPQGEQRAIGALVLGVSA